MRKLRLILVSGLTLIVVLILAACAGENDSPIAQTDAANQPAPTVVAEVSQAPEPTPTPELTTTPEESSAPEPTDNDNDVFYEAEPADDVPLPTTPQSPAPQDGDVVWEITNIQENFFEHRADEFTYQTLIQITNTGEIPIYFGTSRFDLIDESDRILSANNRFSAHPTVLHAGERGYLWASERITGATANTEVTMVPRWDMNRSIHLRPYLELTDIEIRENPNRFIDNLIVFGRITNNTDAEIRSADISIVIYAHDGTPIGVWTTSARDLPAGASFGFEATRSNTIFENLTVEMVGEFTTFAVDFFQRNR